MTEQLDLVTLCTPVEQRAVDLGLLDQTFDFIGRQPLGLAPAAERRQSPADLAVVAARLRESLHREFAANMAAARHDRAPIGVDAEVASAKMHRAGEA